MTTFTSRLILMALLVVSVPATASDSFDFEPSYFQSDLQQIRYSGASGPTVIAGTMAVGEFDDDFGTPANAKSPVKAFLLSAAVPGAGQLYNGSKLKSAAFLGIEAAAWLLHVGYHNDGEDATDVYEAYNRAHWSQTSYEDYLELSYNVRDDELVFQTEVSHHLPDDPNDQQYYEMTGKYDQFAWGWDDAVRNDSTLDMYINESVKIQGPAYTPYSEHRLIYENLRHDANNKYDKATNMLIVVMINHLASGVEAYISARKHNEGGSKVEEMLSRMDLSASLKSYHADRDTPFVRLAFKF